jgi:hypothetical protein
MSSLTTISRPSLKFSNIIWGVQGGSKIRLGPTLINDGSHQVFRDLKTLAGCLGVTSYAKRVGKPNFR